MATRYIVMVRKPNGMMRIIGNKATRKEAEAVAGTDGIIKTMNTSKGRKPKTRALKKVTKQKTTKRKLRRKK